MTIAAAYIPAETERARLRSLEQLAVSGSASEQRFAEVTRVAKRLFQVPMSSIAVMEADQERFKAALGLSPTPVPRERTVCQVTIARSYQRPTNPVLVLEDASAIADFAQLPGIGGDGGVRFYAGHPLYGPGGHAVGVFCIYDTQPRTLDQEQLDAFSELAAWAQRELERSDELAKAASVQRELLPRKLLDLPGYEVASLCVPAFSVGGDFYDHHRTQQGAVFTVADVMGKGMGAAILTATLRSALRGASRALDIASPETGLGWVVGTVSEQLADDFERTDSFATLFHARLRADTGTVEYVDAGHGLALLRGADGATRPLASSGLPLGIAFDDHWDSQRLTLTPGEMLVICSDGLLDILDQEQADIGSLVTLVGRHESATGLVDAVSELACDYPALDDVTVVAVRRSLV